MVKESYCDYFDRYFSYNTFHGVNLSLHLGITKFLPPDLAKIKSLINTGKRGKLYAPQCPTALCRFMISCITIFIFTGLNQRYVEIGILCDLAPPAV